MSPLKTTVSGFFRIAIFYLHQPIYHTEVAITALQRVVKINTDGYIKQ